MTRRKLVVSGVASLAALVLPGRLAAGKPDFCQKNPNHWKCQPPAPPAPAPKRVSVAPASDRFRPASLERVL